MDAKLRKALLYGNVAGLTAALLYQTYNFLSEPAVPSPPQEKIIMDTLFEELKQYPIEPEMENKVLTKDFYLKLYLLHYKYKKIMGETIADSNEQKRISLLKMIQEIGESETEEAESMDRKAKLTQEYEAIILGEKKQLELSDAELLQEIFDYFNLITQ